MKLHEIELYSENPEQSKKLFSDVLGLKLQLEEQNLKVFNPGIDGVDLNISNHYPANKISLSFLVKDLDAYLEKLNEKVVGISEPRQSHLGLMAVTLVENVICKIVIHSPTAESPEWLRRMV